MLTTKGKKVYEDCRRHVLDAVLTLGDADYLEVLEKLSCDFDAAVEAKNEEMEGED